MNKKNKTDIKYMQLALALAKRVVGTTSPNPAVGCVIVKENQIIATGFTQKNGRPHAEQVALSKLSSDAKGACAYVTLEPCCHFGKTNPCSSELIKSGIKRVVIATKDPYYEVDGGGIKQLEDAGVDVVTGVCEKEAIAINCGFFSVQNKNRPYVTVKIATSADGKIALKNGQSKWITGNVARQFSHHLRVKNDAILVGSNTANKDNPSLTCRINGLEDQSPVRIIIGDGFELKKSSNILKNKEIDAWIVASEKKNTSLKQIICKKNEDRQLDLNDVLQKLAENGITRILVEGGGKTITSLIKQGLVDCLIWIKAPLIIGDDGISAMSDLGFESMDNTLRLKLQKSRKLGDDIMEIYEL